MSKSAAKAKAVAKKMSKKKRKFFPGHKTAPVLLMKRSLLPVSLLVVTVVVAVSYLPLGFDKSSFPVARFLHHVAQKCTTLSYALPAGSEVSVPGAEPGTTVYGRGLDDLYVIAFFFFAVSPLSCVLVSERRFRSVKGVVRPRAPFPPAAFPLFASLIVFATHSHSLMSFVT